MPENRPDPTLADPLATGEAATRAVTLLKALSHEGRLQVLCHIAGGERSVGELEAMLDMPQSKVSQLLMRLRSEGLVAARREGRQVFYRIARQEVAEVIAALRLAFCPPSATPG